MEHFCDLGMDANLCLGNNVLMVNLRVLDSLAMQSGLSNISLINMEHMNSVTVRMRFVNLFLSLQTKSSDIRY